MSDNSSVEQYIEAAYARNEALKAQADATDHHADAITEAVERLAGMLSENAPRQSEIDPYRVSALYAAVRCCDTISPTSMPMAYARGVIGVADVFEQYLRHGR